MLINDIPVRLEIDMEEPFSSSSNLNMLTSLRTGRINVFNQTPVTAHVGIKSSKIFATYLDYSYFGEPDIESNFDFNSEIRKKSDLYQLEVRDNPEQVHFVEKDTDTLTTKSICRHTFYKVPHQKDCYISYRLNEQLQALLNEIKETDPKFIIITGKWALFFLTGIPLLSKTKGNAKDRRPLGGLVTYRSSIMAIHECYGVSGCIVMPMYPTIASMRMPDKIPMLELDLQKIGRMYHKIMEAGTGYYTIFDKKIHASEDKADILNFLKDLLARLDSEPTKLSVDIETMFKSIVDCIGITDSTEYGLCVPLAKVGCPNVFSLEDEVEIMEQVYHVMVHPNALHVGQNYNYDTAFFYKLYCLDIHATTDTMVLHHILYNFLPKDLAFLASLYCEKYTYWKGEIDATKEAPETRWAYNVKDVCYTLEVEQVLTGILTNSDQALQDLYRFQQDKLSPILDHMVWRGVRIDVAEKKRLYTFFSGLIVSMLSTVNDVIGEDFNVNSTPQKRKVFKDLLNMELEKSKKGTDTCDAAAMLVYLEKYPLYYPFLQLLLEHASLKVFTNNFLGMLLDEDDRARTQYKIAGTATGRLASVKNVWGRGGNFMNIPSKGKIDLTQAVELADDTDEVFSMVQKEGAIALPNVKKIFIPDRGMEICDGDYSGADIMVVAADAECKWLNDFFASGKGKVYAYVASNFLQREVSTKSREYKTYKAVFHGSNYGMGINRLAMMSGLPIDLAQQLQDYYFTLCPEVRIWQQRIIKDISSKGYITNKFGRRGWYLNKNDPMLHNKAFSFIPQSTIADLVNHAMYEIDSKLSDVQILLQVHDSLVVQYRIEVAEERRGQVKKLMELPIPYDPVLVIPSDIQISQKSYGDVKDLK